MNTKEEAEAKLATLVIDTPVAVSDTTMDGRPRRAYLFTFPDGHTLTIEIDATPSDEQLSDLARQMPIADKDRGTALAVFKAPIADPKLEGKIP